MILDNLLVFDTAVAITVTAPSTNVVDLLNARDMGASDTYQNPKLLVMVNTALLSAGASTLQVLIQGSTDNVTYTTYAESPAIPKAVLVAGARLLDVDMPRPGPGQALPRYLRLNYVVATGPFTGGTLTAALVLGRDDLINYPPGIVVTN